MNDHQVRTLDKLLFEAGPPVTRDELRSPSMATGSRRVLVDPDNVERGLAQLVLTLIDLLRQILERQAIRRMTGGSLTEDEIDRLGTTFMKLAERMDELREVFGLDEADLSLDLGPLSDLIEDKWSGNGVAF